MKCGRVLAFPEVAERTGPIDYSWTRLPHLLSPGQHLQVDAEERSLILWQGRKILAQATLRPLAFRLFVALLLAHHQGKTCPYATLLAIQETNDEQVASLLAQNEASLDWVKARSELHLQRLQSVTDAAVRERLFKPLRRAVREPGGLEPVFVQRGFPWEIQSRYGKGYRLAGCSTYRNAIEESSRKERG